MTYAMTIAIEKNSPIQKIFGIWSTLLMIFNEVQHKMLENTVLIMTKARM